MSALRRFYKKRRSKRYKACSDVVRMTGLEPVRPWATSTSSWPVYQFQHIRILNQRSIL